MIDYDERTMTDAVGRNSIRIGNRIDRDIDLYLINSVKHRFKALL